MPDLILAGDPPIPLILRRSARARRITLRISQLDGRVTLTVPQRAPEREAIRFAQEKEAWIRKHLGARGADVVIGPGAQVPVEGEPREVVMGPGRKVRLDPGCVIVPGAPEKAGRRLAGYLKELARSRLAEASDLYGARLGRRYQAITLRDTRSRWGSCTADGRLMYSWRLILAPAEVLEYVAAHEVAHLIEMNHSTDFWNLVEQIYGDYAAPRGWLRVHGAALHRYRFERAPTAGAACA